MIKPIIVVIAIFFSTNLMAQGIFDDSTIVFKNKDGKVLRLDEAKNIIVSEGPVKLLQKTDRETGEKVVILLPIDSLESKRLATEKDRKINQLKDKTLGNFIFTDIYGRHHDPASLAGKLVVMNFWFIACKPCIEEMPGLNTLVKIYEKKNVIFIAPCNDSAADVTNFLSTHKFEYTIIPDAGSFAEKLGVEAYPTHLIIDKQGFIREVVIGGSADTAKILLSLIEKYISQN